MSTMVASITAATLLVVLAAQDGASASSRPATKVDFLRAMDQHKKANSSSRRSLKSEAEFKKVLRGTSEESTKLRKKLIAKSIVTKHPGSSSSSKVDVDMSGRKLTYMYNEDQDGTDDYFNAYGEWENGIGFDISQYSASYHRCAEVKQFDDVLAATEDSTSVFATKHFAVFRLCPEATCMGFSNDVSAIQVTDCGCKDQCSAAITASVGTDLAACVTSCATQCSIWQQQQYIAIRSTYSSNSGSSARKLQNYNYNNNYQSSWDNFEFDPEYDDGKYTAVTGSRGSGCQSNYGEYMIEVADYLGIMLEWQANRFAEYELYCESCMYDVYMQWLEDGGDARERRLTFEDFKEWDRELSDRQLGNNNNKQGIDCYKYPNAEGCDYMVNGHDYSLCPDGEYYDEDLAAKYQIKMEEKGNINFQNGKYLQPYYCQTYYTACAEYDTCAQYQKIKQIDYYSTYFECTQVTKNNGQTAYVGPHCASDGFTITIGVYSDQYCYDYIGSGVDISSFGIDFGDDEDPLRSYYNSAMGATFEQLKYVESENNECIPCKKSDNMWNYIDPDEEYDESDINELCVALYEYSARCDKHFRVYNTKTSTAKYADSKEAEDLSCDFIDSVIMGNYNELGFVNIGTEWTVEGSSGFMADNPTMQKINQEVNKVSPMQVFGLVASLMACAVLGVWAATLHQSLTKAGPWRPRRGFRAATPAQEIDRQNSGIVVGRSASNTSYYMS